MAAMAFLGLAHTFKRGEMIRVGLLLERLHGGRAGARDRWRSRIAAAFVALFHLARRADDLRFWRFNDMAQGVLAVPMWIPQLGYSGGLVILVDRADRRDGPRHPRQPADATRRSRRRVARGIRRAHRAGRRRLMFADLGMVELSLILLGVMIVMLASGVWIAVALGARRLRRDGADHERAARHRARHHGMERELVMDARGAAAVHLDGRDPVPHQAVRGDVPRPVALGAMAARGG